MNTPQRSSLIVALVSGLALLGAGCSDREPTNTSTARPNTPTATATLPANTGTATGTVATAVDDTLITTSVKSAVLAEPGLSALKIEVDTKDGVVTLSGSVATPDLKVRAMQIAQTTNGVRSVVDNLEVKAS